MKPYVICHMVTTIDGRIKTEGWPDTGVHKAYEKIHKKLKGDAWIIGRTSMEGFSSKKQKLGRPDASIAKVDFIANAKAKTYAVVIDSSGKCRWDSNSITGDHVVEVLSEKVSTAYLKHLQEKGVSYIFAGRSAIDLKIALQKLSKYFGIRRLLLEGGGGINGTFLKAGFIDELSQIVVPVADGMNGSPTLFDSGNAKQKASKLKLKSVTKLPKGNLWLRYTFK